jgi:hypothetical protein
MSQNPVDPPAAPQRHFKGVWLCAALLDDEHLSPAAKILLAEIDSLTHPQKACHASNEFLAKRLHVTPVHMNGLLSDLTQAGYVIRLAFTGRQTLRCVHPLFSSNAETIYGLLSQYGIKLPEERPCLVKATQGCLGFYPKAEAESRVGKKPKAEHRVGKKPKAALAKNPTQPWQKSQPEISSTDIKETTTTTTPPAAANAASTPAPSVVVAPSGDGFEAEEKAREERLEMLRAEFRLNPGQANEVRRIAKDKGLAYLEERVSYTRRNAKKNRTAYLLKLLHEDAQITVEPDHKPKRHLKPDPKPEAAPSEPKADFSAELTWWQSATEAQKEDILRDPRFDLFRKSMRKGVTAASLGLPVLREVLAELARKAACAAAEMAKAQQPEQKAA